MAVRRRILDEKDFSRWTRRDAKERRVMMTLDPVFLSRMQWVWVMAWHILLPAFTVGLASYIAALEGLYLLSEGRYLAPFISLLDPDIRGILCHGRGIGHRYTISIRHKLVTLFGCRC